MDKSIIFFSFHLLCVIGNMPVFKHLVSLLLERNFQKTSFCNTGSWAPLKSHPKNLGWNKCEWIEVSKSCKHFLAASLSLFIFLHYINLLHVLFPSFFFWFFLPQVQPPFAYSPLAFLCPVSLLPTASSPVLMPSLMLVCSLYPSVPPPDSSSHFLASDFPPGDPKSLCLLIFPLLPSFPWFPVSLSFPLPSLLSLPCLLALHPSA